MLKTHYQVRQNRELCTVLREDLTVTERGLVVQILKDESLAEAFEMQNETLNLIWRGELKLSKRELERVKREDKKLEARLLRKFPALV
jgi:hypothetical protein